MASGRETMLSACNPRQTATRGVRVETKNNEHSCPSLQILLATAPPLICSSLCISNLASESCVLPSNVCKLRTQLAIQHLGLPQRMQVWICWPPYPPLAFRPPLLDTRSLNLEKGQLQNHQCGKVQHQLSSPHS